MNVLVVEDEERVLQFLKTALEKEGFRVETASDYAEFRSFVETGTYLPDLLLMDRMLQGHDGTRLIPAARKAFADARILVLSAINTSEEKAAVLDLGADDYLGKPFSLGELLARVRALGRRSSAPFQSYLRAGNVNVDLLNRSAMVSGRRLDLSNKEFQLLALFMKTPGRIYNRFQLLNQIWDAQREIESNVVEVTVRNLRAKLETAGSELAIENRRNVGYWIEN